MGKFQQMKITHRADMEEMVTSSYEPSADVFGVLDNAIAKQHKVATPTQRRQEAERRKGADDRRKDEMLEQGWDPNDRPEDHSMAKLGRILDQQGGLTTDKLQRPMIAKVQDRSRESSRASSRKQSVDTLQQDSVAIVMQLKGQEEKEAAERAQKEKEAKEAADKARREAEEREAAEKAKREQEVREAAEKIKKEKEAKEAAEKAQKEKEAKAAAEKAKKEKEVKEAAEKAIKEQEAKEAAEKAQKDKEAKEAAEKARKEKEAQEAADKAQKEKEAKEAAEKLKQEEEIQEAVHQEVTTRTVVADVVVESYIADESEAAVESEPMEAEMVSEEAKEAA